MRHPLRNVLMACASLAVLLLSATRAAAYPKPSLYPISWELKFQHSDPKRIVVTTPGTSDPVAYWYITYTVVNLTDTEQRFLPVCELLMGDGTVVKSEKEVPGAVFEAIKKREHKKALEPPEKIAGRLLIGEDQAREGVAIWKEPSPRMGTFHIFIGGLSGESVYMKEGQEFNSTQLAKLSDDERKKLTQVVKTLDLTYQVPGDEIKPEEDVVLKKGETWVMR
jgi:hypothetical protein